MSTNKIRAAVPIRKRLRNLRRQKGMTVERAASMIGVSRTTLTRWESGDQRPSSNATLERWAQTIVEYEEGKA